MSSQLGQPLRRKSTGVCMMEQSRQARKFFDLAWFGIGAAGAVDPMAALAAATEVEYYSRPVEFAVQVRLCKIHLTSSKKVMQSCSATSVSPP